MTTDNGMTAAALYGLHARDSEAAGRQDRDGAAAGVVPGDAVETEAVGLTVTPVTLREANAWVKKHHRHHKPVRGTKFAIAISAGDTVRGVALVGRPVSRHADNGWTLEVNRCCTDGVKNGPSMLYRAAWRVASAMGYRRLITYTLPQEGGASLRGAGMRLLGVAGGGNWNKGARPRIDTDEHLRGQKLLWEITK